VVDVDANDVDAAASAAGDARGVLDAGRDRRGLVGLAVPGARLSRRGLTVVDDVVALVAVAVTVAASLLGGESARTDCDAAVGGGCDRRSCARRSKRGLICAGMLVVTRRSRRGLVCR
jgi:hypothetical protein